MNSLRVLLHPQRVLDQRPAAGNGAGDRLCLVSKFPVTHHPILIFESILTDITLPFGIDMRSVNVASQEILISEHFRAGLTLEALVLVISLGVGRQSSFAVKDFIAQAALGVRPPSVLHF